MGISRRALLKSGVAATVFAPALVRHAAAAGDPIVIASMYDLSGGLEAAGKPMFDVLNFAVSEINEAGGLLGREIKVVSFDTQTNMQLYAQYAQEVLTLLGRLNREFGKTIVMVTHDPHAARSATRIRHLEKGELLPEGQVPADYSIA